ncbi:MAG: leucine-rich repeat domain-containing protein [Muribaculaceae bacterium]|nr:leucine-rich repeat domain-containing protein [Muribaculaceae bacterium]
MMLVVGLPSHAHDFVVDGIYYNYIDKDAKTVEVTQGSYPGIGPIGYGNDIIIPSNVTYDGITYSVTTIDEQAFYECPGLTSVIIPNSVSIIGEHVFSGCTGLTSITIPNSVSTIGKYAFSGCTGMTSVTIGNSVSIIGEYVFSGCTGLTSITIPNSVTTIGEYAFGGCKGLTSITIPNSVTTIDNQAFAGCTGLTSVTIPNSVSTIDKYAFSGCRGLTSINIPNSVTTIGEYAFIGCTNLSSIIVENGNSNYDSRDNCNAIIETTSNSLVLGCKNTIIPNSVTSIGDYAFYGCSSLTSIYIPNSVTSIGNDAFDGCKLPILHLPKSVTYVGLYNTCADICYCYNPTPPTGGGYTSDRLYVPKGSMTAYATAEGWKMAKQIMEFDVDDAEKPILTIAYPEGGVIKQEVDNGELLKLQIVPANGWKCHSVTFNSTDVTNQIDANGYYNTPAITANSQLNIVFVKNDGGVANALIENDIKVHVTGNIVTISGADEFSNVEIYNTAGATIYNGIDKSITLDYNGIYILSVEGCTFKFSM